MAEPPPGTASSLPAHSLKGEGWLADPRLQRLMRTIAGSDEEIRIVGGAIRNALLGRPVADVDLATTATPDCVMSRTRRRDMRPIPTGVDHGTVTVLVEGQPFEVTTLREDVATDGRHATVKFSRDWAADARRRDFTVNALYATAGGDVIDLVGGLADCEARRIRFIGDPDARIREDYLRILRLFRFHAMIGHGPVDPDGLAAAVRLKAGISLLSGERIGQELAKLVIADHAPDVVTVMRDHGILSQALATDTADIGAFTRLHAILAMILPALGSGVPADSAILLLTSLAAGDRSDLDRIARRLRLSNAARDRMDAASAVAHALTPTMTDRLARAAIFRAGASTFTDACCVAAARSATHWPVERLIELIRLAHSFQPPECPISGHDLLALGIESGRILGDRLQDLKDAWIASDFTLTKQQLLARLDPRG